jgi:hypothetical protein
VTRKTMKTIRKETMRTMGTMKSVEVAQRKGRDVRTMRAAATAIKTTGAIAATTVETKGRFRIGALFFCLLMNTL